MKIKAVITGDIVHSRRVGDMQFLLDGLKNTLIDISHHLSIPIPFEIYRGDSFQLLLEDPEKAMDVGLLIRSGLRNSTPSEVNESKNMSIENLWDTRISIGIGKIEFPAGKIVESSGEAFKLSGMQLDAMKNSSDKIRMVSAWEELNEQFAVITALSDSIISRWTYHSSQAAYRYLLYKETQKQISENLGISQPAVHSRLSISNIDAIERMFVYLKKTIKNKTDGK
jgi:hypothetical protein